MVFRIWHVILLSKLLKSVNGKNYIISEFRNIKTEFISHFVQIQAGEVMPFIEEILNNTTQIICDLQPHQHHTFYEAVGLMIQSQQDAIIQENLIKRYMALPNQGFKAIIDCKYSDI